MAGHDANTLVQTPAAPNRLADELPITDYPETTAQNVSGSLMADRNAVIDWFGRFLPVGFYYRAFYRPFGVWHWWERFIRKAAGLGVADHRFDAATQFEAELGDLGRFARPGLTGDHHDLVVADRGEDLVPAGRDR